MESEQDTRTYFRSLTENATLLDKLRQATAVQRMFRSKEDYQSCLYFVKKTYYIPEKNGGKPESFNINGGTGDTPNGGIWTSGIGGSDTLDDRGHDYDEGRFTVCSGATYELMREVFDAGEEGIEALKTVLNETGDCPFEHLKLAEKVYTKTMDDERASAWLASSYGRNAIAAAYEKYGGDFVTGTNTYIFFYYIEGDGKMKCRCGSDHPGQMYEHLENHGYWELIPCLLCYKGDITELKGTGKAIYKKSMGKTQCLACKGSGRVTEQLAKTGMTVEIPCVTCCKEFRELKGTGRIDP